MVTTTAVPPTHTAEPSVAQPSPLARAVLKDAIGPRDALLPRDMLQRAIETAELMDLCAEALRAERREGESQDDVMARLIDSYWPGQERSAAMNAATMLGFQRFQRGTAKATALYPRATRAWLFLLGLAVNPTGLMIVEEGRGSDVPQALKHLSQLSPDELLRLMAAAWIDEAWDYRPPELLRDAVAQLAADQSEQRAAAW